jgi:hypothetical protein
LADADRLAEISAEHGVLAIESARERGFPFWDPNNETARRIAFAVADEWVAHLRTVTAEHPNGTAYDTATEQYQQLEETVSNQFGWTNEPEMFISPEMVASIADDTGYMGNSEFLGELDWWSFTNRITFLQEHTPALVKHVLDRGEWRKDD